MSEQKPPMAESPGPEHKGLPICQIFKQSLNFAAGSSLEADLQDILCDSALLPNYSQEPRSVAATDLHTQIILLSKH